MLHYASLLCFITVESYKKCVTEKIVVILFEGIQQHRVCTTTHTSAMHLLDHGAGGHEHGWPARLCDRLEAGGQLNQRWFAPGGTHERDAYR